MPLLAVGLVLASCVLHAYWNLLFKRAGDWRSRRSSCWSRRLSTCRCSSGCCRVPVPAAVWACIGIHGSALLRLLRGAGVGLPRRRVSCLSTGTGHRAGVDVGWGVLLLGSTADLLLASWGSRSSCWGWCWCTGGAACRGARTPSARAGHPPSSLAALLVGLIDSLYSLTDKVGVGAAARPPGALHLPDLHRRCRAGLPLGLAAARARGGR